MKYRAIFSIIFEDRIQLVEVHVGLQRCLSELEIICLMDLHTLLSVRVCSMWCLLSLWGVGLCMCYILIPFFIPFPSFSPCSIPFLGPHPVFWACLQYIVFIFLVCGVGTWTCVLLNEEFQWHYIVSYWWQFPCPLGMIVYTCNPTCNHMGDWGWRITVSSRLAWASKASLNYTERPCFKKEKNSLFHPSYLCSCPA